MGTPEKDPNFACSVMGGIDSAVNAVSEEKYNPVDNIRKFPLRKKPSPEELIKGVSEGDRKTLSQAITLIESNAPRDLIKHSVSCRLSCRVQAKLCASAFPVYRVPAKVPLSSLLARCCVIRATRSQFLLSILPALLPVALFWVIKRVCRCFRVNQIVLSVRPLQGYLGRRCP